MANQKISIDGTNLRFNRNLNISKKNGSCSIILPSLWTNSLKLKHKTKVVIIMDKEGNLFIKNPNLKEKNDRQRI